MASKSATLLVVVVALGAGVAGAYYAGLLPGGGVERPSVTVDDIGDWGEVTDDRIEITHTLIIQNPNPAEVQLGESLTINIQLQLNGVQLGSVEQTGVEIQQGNNTVRPTSELQQNQLAEFWANFINDGETIHAEITAQVDVDAGPGFSITVPPVEVSALTDERPVSDALNRTGDEIEGTYTKEVSTDDIDEQYRPDELDLVGSQSVTAEYTIENVDFEWGTVSADQTELLMEVRVRNTGDTLLPGVPDGTALDIHMNEIDVFYARGEAISPQNIDRDSILRPGEAETYTLVATADNQNIEEWFTTYAAQDEQSSARAELEFYFDLGDDAVSIPRDGAMAYECEFQTDVFVDNQTTSTTCGDNGTVEVGDRQIDQSAIEDARPDGDDDSSTDDSDSTDGDNDSSTDDSDSTDGDNDSSTDDSDSTDDSGSDPTAEIQATPTDGDAPLEVSFDGSGSTDPDGDIEEYVWQFGDGSAPNRGESVTHTYQTAGEYTARLTVIDSAGNEDTTSVTIQVNSRLG